MVDALVRWSLPLIICCLPSPGLQAQTTPRQNQPPSAYQERQDDPPIVVPRDEALTAVPVRVEREGHVAVQVNVDPDGNNIVGDAANEPSIAVDPTDSGSIVIGWRQFDTIASNFRQAGYAYSTDAGASWTFPGVIDPGIFRSDPVLDFDASGTFFYDSLTGDFECDVFQSTNGGASWNSGAFAYGHDKQWMTVDRTPGSGAGHIYQQWSPFTTATFNRSVDGGDTFEAPIQVPEQPYWGTNTVGPDGAVYVSGNSNWNFGIAVIRSSNAQASGQTPTFDQTVVIDLGGDLVAQQAASPNPVGLLGQVWIAADHSNGPYRGYLYLVASVDPPGDDPMDVHFSRSTDGGATWSTPVRINDDAPGTNAWQWFGTMAVAPDGRIDVVWNDTRNDPAGYDSELTYAFSIDGGTTWSANEFLTPAFDPHVGWPQQNKIGDYYDMVSDASGTHIAFSATFNGEEDVYYMRLNDDGIFSDGFESGGTAAWTTFQP